MFHYIDTHMKTFKNKYLARKDKIQQLNRFKEKISNVTKYYEENLIDQVIDYVYKENQSLKLLSVRYKKERFPHLTGIDFSNSKVDEKIEMLKKGENTKPIYIEEATFAKLEVLDSLPKVLQADSKVLANLKKVKQAQRIGVNRAVKTKDDDLLLALKDFQPEIFEPKSLLNIKNSNKYANVPENTVLAIFKESDDPVEYMEKGKQIKETIGRGAGAISINHQYLKNEKDILEIVPLVVQEINKNQLRNKKETYKQARKVAMRRRGGIERS